MKQLNFRKITILLAHALVIWGLCGSVMALVPMITSLENALIIHAIGAPVFAFAVSFYYYRRFHYTSPLVTALIVVLFIIAMDAGLVAPVFEKSFDMFRSPLGTWIPFGLIFLSMYFTGILVTKKESIAGPAS